MELVLPTNYVDIDQDEMMYLDGGNWARDTAIAVIASTVGAIVGYAVKHSYIELAIRLAGGWLANQINAAVVVAVMNPALAVGTLAGLAVLGGTVYWIGRNQKWW